MSEHSAEKDAAETVRLNGHVIAYVDHRYECQQCGARLLSMMQFNGRECRSRTAIPAALWLPAVMQEPVSNVISTEPEGYSIVLCHCEEGPYIGARKAGTPCCCERCGFMTREQWDALAAAALHRLRDLLDRTEADAREHQHLARLSVSEIREYVLPPGEDRR